MLCCCSATKPADESAAPHGDKAGKARSGKPEGGAPVHLPLAHVLSKELQAYYARVSDFLLQRPAHGQLGEAACHIDWSSFLTLHHIAHPNVQFLRGPLMFGSACT